MVYKRRFSRSGRKSGLLAFILASSILSAGSWAKYGWQLFEQPGDARVIALGGAQIANGKNVSSVISNPANSDFSTKDLIIGHQSRFGGIVEQDLLSFSVIKGAARPFHIMVLQQNVSGIPFTKNGLLDWGNDGQPGTFDEGEGNGILDEGERLDQNSIRSFAQQQWGVYVSTARRWHSWNVGLGAKGLYHSIRDHQAIGFGIHAGISRRVWKTITIGATVRDLTSSWLVWDNGTVEGAKPVFAGGVSGEFTLPGLSWPVIWNGDVGLNMNGQSLDQDFSVAGMGGFQRWGIEIVPGEVLRVRLGRDENQQLSGGMGLRWSRGGLDYAYKPDGSEMGLGSSHYLSFSIAPGWLLSALGLSD